MSWLLSCIGCGNKKLVDREETRSLDFQHYSLKCVPPYVFECERFLEELYLDFNQINELPKELFLCHELQVLSLSDNDLHHLPPAISSLTNLTSLDISKNGISDIPDVIKSCKRLHSVNASTNPLCRLPEGFTQLIALKVLSLSDTFLEYLPANFGRLSGLEVLDLRENQLNTLPRSITRLTALKKLDLGQNEFSELPEVIGHLSNLTDLWLDNNRIKRVPSEIGHLTNLTFLDASKNRLVEIDPEIGSCKSLTHLYFTRNNLEEVPEELCNCTELSILHLDDNQMENLPESLGKLVHLQELKASQNELSVLPSSIGLLRTLQFLHVDENLLKELPSELGSCSSLLVLTAAHNQVQSVPAELGSLCRLKVLNLCCNSLVDLPVSFSKLQLSALWLSENQARPSVQLQCSKDVNGQKVLTCFMLPQSEHQELSSAAKREDEHQITEEEIEARRAKRLIHFASDGDAAPKAPGGLCRIPTPYPKELRALAKHTKNIMAMKKEKQKELDPVGASAEEVADDKISKATISPQNSEIPQNTTPKYQEENTVASEEKYTTFVISSDDNNATEHCISNDQNTTSKYLGQNTIASGEKNSAKYQDENTAATDEKNSTKYLGKNTTSKYLGQNTIVSGEKNSAKYQDENTISTDEKYSTFVVTSGRSNTIDDGISDEKYHPSGPTLGSAKSDHDGLPVSLSSATDDNKFSYTPVYHMRPSSFIKNDNEELGVSKKFDYLPNRPASIAVPNLQNNFTKSPMDNYPLRPGSLALESHEPLWTTSQRPGSLASPINTVGIPSFDTIPSVELQNDTLSQKNDTLGQKNETLGQKNDILGQKNDILGQKNDILGQKNDSVIVKSDTEHSAKFTDSSVEEDTFSDASTSLDKGTMSKPVFGNSSKTAVDKDPEISEKDFTKIGQISNIGPTTGFSQELYNLSPKNNDSHVKMHESKIPSLFSSKISSSTYPTSNSSKPAAINQREISPDKLAIVNQSPSVTGSKIPHFSSTPKSNCSSPQKVSKHLYSPSESRLKQPGQQYACAESSQISSISPIPKATGVDKIKSSGAKHDFSTLSQTSKLVSQHSDTKLPKYNTPMGVQSPPSYPETNANTKLPKYNTPLGVQNPPSYPETDANTKLPKYNTPLGVQSSPSYPETDANTKLPKYNTPLGVQSPPSYSETDGPKIRHIQSPGFLVIPLSQSIDRGTPFKRSNSGPTKAFHAVSPMQDPINQTGIPLPTQGSTPQGRSSRIPTHSSSSLRGRKSKNSMSKN